MNVKIESIPSKIAIAITLFLLPLLFFGLMAHEVAVENEGWLDKWAFNFLTKYSSPAIIQFFNIITFFGSTYFLIPAYIIVIFFLIKNGRKSDAIDVLILGATSTMLMVGLKMAFARERPDMPIIRELDSYSFPSGHALSSFIFYMLLSWEIWKSSQSRNIKILATAFAVLFSISIGMSRIVLRYHYASDVFAGLCLGLAYVILFFWIQTRFRNPGKISVKKTRVN